jgi:hypothetical protein
MIEVLYQLGSRSGVCSRGVLSEPPDFGTRSNYAKSNRLRGAPVPNVYLFGIVSTKNHP